MFVMSFFFVTDTATIEIYTLSLHDALPIFVRRAEQISDEDRILLQTVARVIVVDGAGTLRSEEHTSELQSLTNLVCRLLLEKKKVCQLSCVGWICLQV